MMKRKTSEMKTEGSINQAVNPAKIPYQFIGPNTLLATHRPKSQQRLLLYTGP
jgi:hypothetical protein